MFFPCFLLFAKGFEPHDMEEGIYSKNLYI